MADASSTASEARRDRWARGASGALDGEVAFLMRTVEKDALFLGGAASVAGRSISLAWPPEARDHRVRSRAWDAYVEQAAKAVAALLGVGTATARLVLSVRTARNAGVA